MDHNFIHRAVMSSVIPVLSGVPGRLLHLATRRKSKTSVAFQNMYRYIRYQVDESILYILYDWHWCCTGRTRRGKEESDATNNDCWLVVTRRKHEPRKGKQTRRLVFSIAVVQHQCKFDSNEQKSKRVRGSWRVVIVAQNNDGAVEGVIPEQVES